jgi:hypothetical protein
MGELGKGSTIEHRDRIAGDRGRLAEDPAGFVGAVVEAMERCG